MKKQDIRSIYTQKVAELLEQGYTIFPDTMGGSQGEIAHIDLTNGSEILRVLLYRDHHWERGENGYIGDTVCLTVGKAAPDTPRLTMTGRQPAETPRASREATRSQIKKAPSARRNTQ